MLVDDLPELGALWRRSLWAVRVNVEIEHVVTIADARERLRPDAWLRAPFEYVVLDLRLPDGNGEELMPELRRMRPRPLLAVQSGFLKAATQIRLAGACEVVTSRLRSANDMRSLLLKLDEIDDHLDPVSAFARRYGLPLGEVDCLRGFCAGRTRKEVAVGMGVTPGTVAAYEHRILKATGLKTMREVVATVFVPVGSRAKAITHREADVRGA